MCTLYRSLFGRKDSVGGYECMGLRRGGGVVVSGYVHLISLTFWWKGKRGGGYECMGHRGGGVGNEANTCECKPSKMAAILPST